MEYKGWMSDTSKALVSYLLIFKSKFYLPRLFQPALWKKIPLKVNLVLSF